MLAWRVMVVRPRLPLALLAILQLCCGRETPVASSPAVPPPAPVVTSAPSTQSAAPEAKPTPPLPSAAASAPAPPSAPPSAPPRPPHISGEIAALSGAAPFDVRLTTAEGALTLRGVDGRSLDWRVGDRVTIAGQEGTGGVVDCRDATRCSVGLESGGDVVLRGADVHAGLRVLAALGAQALAVGPSRTAWLELRATSDDVMLRSLATATGLGLKAYKGLSLLAPPDVIAKLSVRRVQSKTYTVDMEVAQAEIGGAMDLFSFMLHTPMRGERHGNVSIFARNADAADLLDAMFALCGITAVKKGRALELDQRGETCRREAVQPWRCPEQRFPPQSAVQERLSCLEPTTLQVLGIALRADKRPVALLGQGPVRGDEIAVREGDFIAPPVKQKTDSGELHVYWRVETIQRDAVTLLLSDPPSNFPEQRATLPFAP